MSPLLGMVRGMTVAKARFPVLPDRITPHSVDCTKALSSVVQGISCQFLDLDVREVVETPSSQSVCGPGWAYRDTKSQDLGLGDTRHCRHRVDRQIHLESGASLSCSLTRDLMYPGVSQV
jgi:hypothetical protein